MIRTAIEYAKAAHRVAFLWTQLFLFYLAYVASHSCTFLMSFGKAEMPQAGLIDVDSIEAVTPP